MLRSLIISAGVALTLDIIHLLHLHDLLTAPSWLVDKTVLALVVAAKVALLAWWVRLQDLPLQWRALRRLSVVLVLVTVVPLLTPLVPPAGEEGLAALFGRSINQTMLLGVLGLVVALAWFLAGVELMASNAPPWHGYRDPVIAATWIIAVATLLFFFRTPKLLGHVLLDLSVLGMVLASHRPSLSLGRRARGVLCGAAITVLCVVYVVPLLYWAGHTLYALREDASTLGAARVNMAARESPSALLASLDDYEIDHRVATFNDIWLLADGSALAITDYALWRREQAGEAWHEVTEFPWRRRAHYLHVDGVGERGVVGAWRGSVLRTYDGGETWRALDTDELFESLAGRKFGDKLLDDASAVFLDPATGVGSFMMGCRFFSSTDFGDSWQMTQLFDAAGKRRCVASSPFAVDLTLGLASAQFLGERYLLHRQEAQAPWEPLCTLDEWAGVAADGAASCDDVPLTPAQQGFVDRLLHEAQYLYRQLEDGEVIEALLAGARFPAQDMRALVRDNGEQRWVSGPGVLFTGAPGQELVVDHRVPPLDAIAPLDDQRALGVADGRLLQTRDGGRVWRALARSAEVSFELLPSPPRSAVQLVQTPDGVSRWDGAELHLVLPLVAGQWITQTLASPDGVRWLLRVGDARYFLSLDHTERWREYSIPTPPAAVAADGWASTVSLATMDCDLSLWPAPCVGVFEDGSAYRWPADQPQAVERLADVGDTDDPVAGTIALLGPNAQAFFMAAETSWLYRLDGNAWQGERTGAVLPYDPLSLISAERDRWILRTAHDQLLLIDDAGVSTVVQPNVVGEVGNTSASSGVCEAGERLVFTHERDLALGRAQGWRQARVSDRLGTACGSRGESLWVKADGLVILRRRGQ